MNTSLIFYISFLMHSVNLIVHIALREFLIGSSGVFGLAICTPNSHLKLKNSKHTDGIKNFSDSSFLGM